MVKNIKQKQLKAEKMAKALYLEDSYMKEFEATVVKITDGKY